MKTTTFFKSDNLIKASIISLIIMLFVDYLLGSEAEFLNAWYILNQWIGNADVAGQSFVTLHLGLFEATIILIMANILIGYVLLGILEILRVVFRKRKLVESVLGIIKTCGLVLFFFGMGGQVYGQNNDMKIEKYWQVGLGFGELPMAGSFKPSITVGYHFTERVYAGVIYQFSDEIKRDGTSFNAKSAGLEGLTSSNERVDQRLMLQARYTPFKHGPFISTGIVYNGRDVETMHFDHRSRNIAGNEYSGDIVIQQARPAGWGAALGLGYQYNFDNGLSAGFEWTPAWLQYPDPEYDFSGNEGLSESAIVSIKDKMDAGFNSSVTNMYKVFHIGLAYRFKTNQGVLK